MSALATDVRIISVATAQKWGFSILQPIEVQGVDLTDDKMKAIIPVAADFFCARNTFAAFLARACPQRSVRKRINIPADQSATLNQLRTVFQTAAGELNKAYGKHDISCVKSLS